MVPAIRAVTAARCIAETFTAPNIFGLQTVSLTASVVSNWTRHFTLGRYLSHPAQNVCVDFCNVSLITTHPGWDDYITTQVWLPLDESDWNGRLQMTGGGGLATGLRLDQMTCALSSGYSSVSTDGGHDATNNGSWALASPGNANLYLLADYASVSLHEAVVIGKSITEEYYTRAPAYSYFTGCSTGGRQGLQFAQRYPDDFDGILACAPGIDTNIGQVKLFYPMATLHEYGTFPRECKLASIRAASVAECDPKDGVVDNIISAPELCSLDPFSLVGSPATACKGGGDVNISYAAALGAHAFWTGDPDRNYTLFPAFYPGAPMSGLLAGKD